MTYISGSRADQWNQEDRQASVDITDDQAKILNFLDRAVADIERARAINDDIRDEKVMASWVKEIRSFQSEISEGW